MKRAAAVLALAAAVAAAGAWAAGEQGPAAGVKGAPEAVKEMEGTTCPVLGMQIDKKYHYTYKGTVYYFCCPACIGQFKADPEKYIGKMRKK